MHKCAYICIRLIEFYGSITETYLQGFDFSTQKNKN